MGIKFRCHECDKKLHVKSFLAGKRGVCPKCGAKIRIPLESQDTSQPHSTSTSAANRHSAAGSSAQRRAATHPAAGSARRAAGTRHNVRSGGGGAKPPDPIAESPDAVWYVRPPSGGQFGPADGQIMRRWLDEGRISADALVWREGWSDWKTAGPLFPALAASQTPVDDAVTDPVVHEFDFADQAPAAQRITGRRPSKSTARNIALVVMLSVMCVALLIALVVVLRGQG